MIVQVINMKKIITAAESILLIAAFLLCITQAQSVREAVQEASERCLLTVIPSLYAIMIVSSLIAKSGILTCLPSLLSKISVRAGMKGYIISVLFYSMFAGYPVGLSVLLSETAAKRLDKRTAAVLSGVCFGAGPSFIFGCISQKLYSSTAAGTIIIISGAAANIIIAAVFLPFLKKCDPVSAINMNLSFSSDMLSKSILSAGRSMAGICFSITAFSAASCFLDILGLTANTGALLSKLTGLSEEISRQLVYVFLDVTNISGLPENDLSLLPYISGLVSFGGICVMLQLSAIAGGKISLKPLMLTRIAAAFLSGAICRMIMPYFLRHEITAASTVNVHTHREISPVPSIMLIIMTIMLFANYDKTIKLHEPY